MGFFTIRYGEIVESIVTECIVSKGNYENPKQDIDSTKCLAIWDSGATSSIITRKVIETLDLKPVGMCQVVGIHGSEYEYTYYVNLMVPGEMEFYTLEVTEGDLDDVDVLIGMDVILQGDLAVSNGNSETTFSFRSPAKDPIVFAE